MTGVLLKLVSPGDFLKLVHRILLLLNPGYGALFYLDVTHREEALYSSLRQVIIKWKIAQLFPLLTHTGKINLHIILIADRRTRFPQFQ